MERRRRWAWTRCWWRTCRCSNRSRSRRRHAPRASPRYSSRPPNADDARLAAIAAAGEAYTYVTSREGVTGTDERLHQGQAGLIAKLKALGAPPPVLGFGIATPEHVRTALAMGAAGAISGSAVVRLAAEGGDVAAFVRRMKAATRG